MEIHRVLVVGDSLFAETLIEMLAKEETIQIAGSAPSLEEALRTFNPTRLDTVILAEVGQPPVEAFTQFLSAYPEISIIRTNMDSNDVHVLVNQRFSVRTAEDLLAVIAALPKRSQPNGIRGE
jgi:DNA-binding NarL/FixJ family response regulator